MIGIGLVACGLAGAVIEVRSARPELDVGQAPPAIVVGAAVHTHVRVAGGGPADAEVWESVAGPWVGSAAPGRPLRLKERFLRDPDLASLFQEVVERAGDGDGEAAYYAYRIHELCFQGLAGLADPTSWPEQARLAAEGEWGALKALQAELRGGR